VRLSSASAAAQQAQEHLTEADLAAPADLAQQVATRLAADRERAWDEVLAQLVHEAWETKR
jgi:hypothetical protein